MAKPIDPGNKIKTLQELKVISLAARESGRKIVFTNGCFDLIHVGHIRYLQHAGTMGDILIAGINSDACVKMLKGEGRPLQPQNERAEILASIGCVDFVLIFDTPTADPILEELRPDIHAKGADYTEDSVPERETVASYGGALAIAGDLKNHSTRDLITTILSRFNS
ncbi:MAG TPA: adenylyltransferase/cytidyltransferase family protein [Acidobacteriota bacterium]|nr:adenylyltransferase/cytidyltransferase family protein [Acidobacteriota bacterium]